MGGMIANRELVLNQLGDAWARPHIPTEAEGLGAFKQQSHKLGTLFGIQPRLGTRGGMRTQGRGTLQGGALEPLANRTLSNTEGLRDMLLSPALLVQFPSSQTPTFTPVGGRGVLCCIHKIATEHFPAHHH
jgi:hypothetical protein